MPTSSVSFNSKLPGIGQSIFSVMTAMANQYNAINLAQGFPDFNCPDYLIERMHHHMLEGRNQYAPMPGIPALKEKLANKINTLYQVAYDPEKEITITAGATQAISVAITAVVREGDEVILFEPAYDSYLPNILLNKGIPRYVKLKPPYYQIDWEEVKKLVNRKTKLIILNNPQNPCGTVFKEEDMKQLEQIVDNSDIMLLSDEVYEHIVFDGHKHQSICRFENLASRAFVIFSFGKTYHNTGWKSGYIIAPAKMTEEFRKVFSYNMFSVLTPAQYALADMLDNEEYYMDLGNFYQQKRNVFLNSIEGSAFKPTVCNGAYFQCLDYSDVTDKNDVEFATWLTQEAGVASIPTSVFYHDKKDYKVLRFCFAKGEEVLKEAGERLKAVQF